MRLGQVTTKSAAGEVPRPGFDEARRRSGQENIHVDRGRDNDPEEFSVEMEETQMVQPEQGSRNRRATSNRQAKRTPEINLKSRGRRKTTGPQEAGERQQRLGEFAHALRGTLARLESFAVVWREEARNPDHVRPYFGNFVFNLVE